MFLSTLSHLWDPLVSLLCLVSPCPKGILHPDRCPRLCVCLLITVNHLTMAKNPDTVDLLCYCRLVQNFLTRKLLILTEQSSIRMAQTDQSFNWQPCQCASFNFNCSRNVCCLKVLYRQLLFNHVRCLGKYGLVDDPTYGS